MLLFYLFHLYHYYCNYFLLYHRPKSTKLNCKLNYIIPIICIIFYYITIIPIIVFDLYYGHYIKLNLIISDKMNYIHYGNYINNFPIIISTNDIAFKSLIYGSCSRRGSWTDFRGGRATASSLTNTSNAAGPSSALSINVMHMRDTMHQIDSGVIIFLVIISISEGHSSKVPGVCRNSTGDGWSSCNEAYK